ncbi:nuclear transcription factor Y subunit B-1-like protein isoform X1 [Cinnamomum micranthum f. kanehirae]|uniref:Nuclear transcription factor Y subunit B-1-like protein isoform X1 n=1 Tax=Cinnamomum micranthum f. kanehirae TaxID=337451 RepID=A0A443NTE7_9MAGN|nr:nuclear transcription factor Y subunit B-1-like protein isoform X1 [Cinnamomum micranthum f. kanehirae]
MPTACNDLERTAEETDGLDRTAEFPLAISRPIRLIRSFLSLSCAAKQQKKISLHSLARVIKKSRMADLPTSPGGSSHESGDRSPRFSIREQDRFLPIANISRIMKKGVPTNGKIAKDAKETVQECVSEFISFITSEASDKCQREKRKTINGDDLLWAMMTLGFEDYIDPLKVYLHKFREDDTKGSAKSGDGSGKKDAVGVQVDPNSQIAYQGSFTQGVNYMHS